MAVLVRLVVSQSVGQAPLQRFLGRLPLSMDTGVAGDRPRIDPTATLLTASMRDRMWDALHDQPAAAVSGATADGVRVTLDAPRLVVRLRTPSTVPGPLSLYRLDGTTFAVEPTTHTSTVAIGVAANVGVAVGGIRQGGGAGVAASGRLAQGGQQLVLAAGRTHAVLGTFVDGDFGVGGTVTLTGVDVRSEPAGVALGLVPATATDDEAVRAAPFWRADRPGADDLDAGSALAAALQDLVDDLPAPLPSPLGLAVAVTADGPFVLDVEQFAVAHRLERSGFAPLPLVRSDVADADGLVAALRTGRTAPAVFLRGLLADPPGVVTGAGTLALVDTTTATGPALVDRVLARLSDGLATTALWDPARFAGIDVPGEVAAAAGVATSGERLIAVNRDLLELALPGVVRPRTDGRDLDLADDPEVVVRRPPGGAVTAAPLLVVDDTDAGQSADQGGDVGGTLVGAEVTVAGPIAAVVLPTIAVRVTAVEVLLAGAGPATRVVAELREDHAGLPAGRALARGEADVPAGGHAWVRVTLPDPVVLPTRDHWLALRAGAGRAVWVVRPDPTARWARALEDPGGSARPGATPSAAASRDVVWEPWAVSGEPVAARLRLVTNVDQGQPAGGLAVTVDGVDLPPVPGDPAARDLTAAMTTGAVGAAEVLVVRARGTGRVRLKPPRIDYEPG